MNLDLHVLHDLTAGQSTADSLALRLKIPADKAIALLVTLKRAGKVDSFPLAGLANLHVYRLTLAGKQDLAPSKL